MIFPNRKVYFGIAQNVDKRFAGHLRTAERGTRNYPVYNALRKYKGQVVCKTLCSGANVNIQALEIWAIAEFGTTDRRHGYNLALGGETSPMHNPEVAARVSQTKRNRYRSDPAYRAAITQSLQKLNSPEVRARILATIRTPEVRAAKSKKLRGRKRSEAQLVVMRARAADPAHRAKLSDSIRKAWANPVLRAEQSVRFKGRIISIEQRRQISATLMGHPGAGKGVPRPEISALISSLVWVTNGVESRRLPKSQPLPEGWWLGRKDAPTEAQLRGLAAGWSRKNKVDAA